MDGNGPRGATRRGPPRRCCRVLHPFRRPGAAEGRIRGDRRAGLAANRRSFAVEHRANPDGIVLPFLLFFRAVPERGAKSAYNYIYVKQWFVISNNFAWTSIPRRNPLLRRGLRQPGQVRSLSCGRNRCLLINTNEQAFSRNRAKSFLVADNLGRLGKPQPSQLDTNQAHPLAPRRPARPPAAKDGRPQGRQVYVRSSARRCFSATRNSRTASASISSWIAPLADHDDGPDALEMCVRLPVGLASQRETVEFFDMNFRPVNLCRRPDWYGKALR